MYATTQNRNRLGLTCAELLPYLAPAEASSSSAGAGAGAGATNVVEHVDKTAFSMCVPHIMRHFGAAAPSDGSNAGAAAGASSSFAAAASPSFNGGKAGQDKAHGQAHEIAVLGIEAHVCVTQTALDLLAHGHTVYILADGVSSSHPGEASTALARLRSAGAVVTTSESWLFEVMGDANIPESVSLSFILSYFFAAFPFFLAPFFSSVNQDRFFCLFVCFSSYFISQK